MKILDLLARGIGSLFREHLSRIILAETMEDDQTTVMNTENRSLTNFFNSRFAGFRYENS